MIEATCLTGGSHDLVLYYTKGNVKISSTHVTVPALGHDITHYDEKEPTCTEVGWNAYETCSRCDYSTYNEIPATDHTWGDWYEAKTPTLTEAGEERRDCDNCDYYETSTIPALGYSDIWGSLTWTLNETTGELVISGVGEMDDFEWESTSAWREYKDLIKSVTIKNGVVSIGAHAFTYCESLTDISIPESVITIRESALNSCYSLVNIDIPDSVTSIGMSVFCDCFSLENVNFGENSRLTSIGDIAFAWCGNLVSIEIPCNLSSIGNEAFLGCGGLKSINVDENNLNFQSIDGNLYTKDGKTLIQYTIGKTDTMFVIPNGVTNIANSAFFQCGNLTRITIPSSVTYISETAFNGCYGLADVYYTGDMADWCGISPGEYLMSAVTNLYVDGKLVEGELVIPDGVPEISAFTFVNRPLTRVVIPASVESIGDLAFYDCSSLVSIDMPDNIKHIGAGAFYGCSSLASIVIPASVTTIDFFAFYECASLTDVYYKGTKEQWNNIVIGSDNDDLLNASIYFWGDSDEELSLISGTWGSLLWTLNETTGELVISGTGEMDDFTQESTSAWRKYKDCIKSVTIENSVSTIGANAFKNCSNLTSIVIPDGVTIIGTSAFYRCSNLTSITLPFVGATKGGTENTHFGYIFGASAYNFNQNYVPSSLKEVVITGGTTIGDYSFAYCDSITSATIPDSVISIGYAAFRDCNNLTSITLPFVGATKGGTENTHLGYIFGASAHSSNSSFVPTNLKEVVITGGATIGDGAFYYCSGLTSVTFGDECQSTTIGKEAFINCTSLTIITIPDSVTSIGYAAFLNCSSLTIITLPNSVTTIGDYAFLNCTSLTSITIPDSVTTIGDYAFAYCNSLTSVYYGGTEKDWTNVAIGSYNTELTEAAIYHYSEFEPATGGKYWHYVDGVITKW